MSTRTTYPRRLAKSIALALSVALLAVSCGGGDTSDRVIEGVAASIYAGDCVADADSTIVVYSGRSENLIEPVLDAFMCETGIEVEVRWAGSSELALLIETEGDRTPADVFLSKSPGPVGFLEAKNLLGELYGDVLGLTPSQNQSDQGTWVGFSGRKRVLVYNLDQVTTAELPTSVFELTGPEWKDRVAIPGTNGSFVDWFTVFRDQAGDDVATQWLNDMVANGAKYYPNNRSTVEAVGRGEADVGLVNHYYNYQVATAIGDDHRALNHDFGDDDLGSLLIISAASVTKATDNADDANAFIAYLLSDPVQSYLTNDTFEYPLAAGVTPAEILPPLAALEIGTVDFNGLGGGLEETTNIIDASGIANQ